VLVAVGGGFAAGGETALDLGGGAELVVADGDAAGGGEAHVGGPCVVWIPDEAGAMAEEAGLGVIGDVVAREVFGDAGLGGGLVAGEVELGEKILNVDGPDYVVAGGDGGEEFAGVEGVEFVHVGAAPPVAGLGVVAVMVEDVAAEAVAEWLAVAAEEEDASGIGGGGLPGDVPGGVGAAVIVNVNEIAPGELVPQGVFHEVGFVFGQADSVDFHRTDSLSRRGGKAMRQ